MNLLIQFARIDGTLSPTGDVKETDHGEYPEIARRFISDLSPGPWAMLQLGSVDKSVIMIYLFTISEDGTKLTDGIAHTHMTIDVAHWPPRS